MSKYVIVGGTNEKNIQGALHFSRNDINYNLRLAKKKRDKKTYVRMLKLRSHVNYGIRMQDSFGHPTISLRLETWKNGQKYVVRNMNGGFRAVIDK